MSSKTLVARLSVYSILVALGVMGLKFVAWQMTGSVALYSDALESIVNVISACAAFWAIRVSHRPADENHQHGHHKAEYFSAVLEGVLIVVAAMLIMAEVWRSWAEQPVLELPATGLAISSIASLINGVFAVILIRAGRAARSPALVADGNHILTDVVTTVGVLAGLIGAMLTGWHLLDPLLALFVAVNILWQGAKVIGQSMQGLMDIAVDPDTDREIRAIIARMSTGALEIHDLKTRIAGRATFVEFHLVVDADMSVGESHMICDRIEDGLREAMPGIRVLIHVEPHEEAKLDHTSEAARSTGPGSAA